MAPTGNDANDGLTLDSPIKTLNRAQAIIADNIAQYGERDVLVRIGPGEYLDQSVVWTTTMAQHSITFMPLFNDKVRPVFKGSDECQTWFKLAHSKGEDTNIQFKYIHVEKYGAAISLEGSRNAEGASNSNNHIYGMYFKNIGNVACTSASAPTAAIRLINSDNNDISNNHFVNIINDSGAGLIHALYVAHMSDDNVIRANRFVDNSGDPVRLRDYSNRNVIYDNKMYNTGIVAGYTDWYCDHDVRDDCTKVAPECPSWDNAFRNNGLGLNYASGANLGTFRYFQDEVTTGCEKPTSSSVRLRTSGNYRL